ncbi:hypothetical protein HGRIS_003097 [Hohenbuehelia grisea]|uniref:ADP-ribosylhydrolase ARH3 n=1 Tax=Hohenbuehelia grisea TaxID=104357 RepID=A0ABR3JMP4_9AGAR
MHGLNQTLKSAFRRSKHSAHTTDTNKALPDNSNTPLLVDQVVVPADAATKIRLSILATALVDALGGPAEFQQRYTFPTVTSMIPNANFKLGPGVWTDDTSMTLCLAHSLATSPRGFDEAHQLDMYVGWRERGEHSAVDRCFDIGHTTQRALTIWVARTSSDEALEQIRQELGGENAGNGSLMRLVPIGLAYWRDEQEAMKYARRSSSVTHPSPLCQEACEVWAGAIARIVSAASQSEKFSKLDLLQYFSAFPYTQSKLRDILALPSDAPAPPTSNVEEFYQTHHPLLQLIAKGTASAQGPVNLPPPNVLPSSGYVLHTLVAALYCFFSSSTFEGGAIMAVNLGNDADTVGAVYGGIAGCWYSAQDSKDSSSSLFWSKRVKEWKKALVKREQVEGIADELVQFSEKNIPRKYDDKDSISQKGARMRSRSGHDDAITTRIIE